MTTRWDILDAKQDYEAHLAVHHCLVGDGCPERIRLLKAYNLGPNSAAGRWGLDYDDHDRRIRQFNERVKHSI
jgi:hypothetical protein